ncbi:Nif3-like dinuclear metal center hexameric protein [Aquirufa sp. ROCK-SH2]
MEDDTFKYTIISVPFERILPLCQNFIDMTIKDVCDSMEKWAPLQWQESYDNAGLLVGNKSEKVNGVLISLDCTEEVVEEAIQAGCNLIIAHHPIVFKGLKSFTGKNYVERTVIKAIQNNVAIYASHTNLDHAPKGVSYHLAQKLGIQNGRILKPFQGALKNLIYYVPKSHEEVVRTALHQAGAGNIGEYSSCSFQSAGLGRFTPSDSANPTLGKANQEEQVEELKVEMIFPQHLEASILQALHQAHPYEEIAYSIIGLDNTWKEVGSGYIGSLPKALPTSDFLQYLKEHLELPMVRFTATKKDLIETVAVCGGAGSFLISEAKRQKADAYISADIKYHEFFDAENECLICDIGHYESEVMIKEAIHEYLSNIFSTFAVLKSKTLTNPVGYA